MDIAPSEGPAVDALALCGKTVLLVEDEPMIAIEIERALAEAGANVVMASTRARALQAAEHPGLAAAVLDYRLQDGDCTSVWTRLRARGIPAVIYTGYDAIE